jgi:hypothetical protein
MGERDERPELSAVRSDSALFVWTIGTGRVKHPDIIT